MKQVCIYCNRTSPHRNLWCQETYCEAELAPVLMSYGEQLGDFEIIKPLLILRSSVLYKAQQGRTEVFLKVAHIGQQERLQREARFLMELRHGGSPSTNRKGPDNRLGKLIREYPVLPILLPPYEGEDIREHYYGKTVFRGESKYFTVFQFSEGETLRSLLLDNPQPWYKHVGRLMVSITDAVALMHHQNVYHLCLSPDLILVRYDKQNVPRPMLIDLGVVSAPQEMNLFWDSWFTPPAYRPPEVVQSSRIVSGPATDVYGLGCILFELLAGQPAYPYQQRTDLEIKNSVLRGTPTAINRPDLTGIPEIAEQAISKNYNNRQPNVLTFLAQLQHFFPTVPKEQQQRRINWRLIAIVATVFLAVALLLVLALSVVSGL